MILINYKDGKISEADRMPLGAAICGRGVDAILFDAKDFDNMVEMFTHSDAGMNRMVDYLSSLICRFGPGDQTHEAILKGK